jgi:acylphosphatase
MLVARRFLVTGRVQRVGFRMFAREAADVEGLHGWVANRPDGSVEGEVEGDREAVERFERRLYSGPPGARIVDVEIVGVAPAGRRTGFEIRM